MSNVVCLVQNRQTKLIDYNFVHTLRSNLTLSFSISQLTTIKPASKNATVTLDIDNSGEYLLAGDACGGLAIYDINKQTENGANELTSVCAAVGNAGTNSHKFSVESVKWYPHDSGLFVSGSSDKTVKIWDTNEMTVVEDFKFSGHVYDVDLSRREGKTMGLIATALSTHQIKLCDMNTGSDTHTLRGHEAAVNCVTWSKRNSYALFSGGRDGKIIMWDIRRSKAAVCYFDRSNASSEAAHSGSVTSVVQTEDGLFLLSSGQDRQVRLWDVNLGENTFRNFGSAGTADVKRISTAVSHKACYPGLLYLPNGSDIGVYDILTGNHLTDYTGHFGRVNAVHYNETRPQLYTCSSDCTILVWEPPPPEDITEVENNPCNDAWSSSESDAD